MKFSVSEENYIKAIYHLQEGAALVGTNDLADHLQTRPASVTDMLKKLKTKKLLSYEPYKGVRLNKEGKKLALLVIRKHRLWESFLVQKLQFGWDEVHEVAEELEHIRSRKLIDQLDAFLGYPKFDPHGDPIPDAKGEIAEDIHVCLSHLPLHCMAELTGIRDQSASLLELLKLKGIQLGTRLEIKQIFAFDYSVEIKIKNQSCFTLSKQVADVIFVKPV